MSKLSERTEKRIDDAAKLFLEQFPAECPTFMYAEIIRTAMLKGAAIATTEIASDLRTIRDSQMSRVTVDKF